MSDEVKTYSTRPITSYDGPDGDGVRAEVAVVTGYGVPKQPAMSDAGKAANVTFPVDNTKHASSGWVPVAESVYSIVQEAYDNDTPIHFRIERVRKQKDNNGNPIDRSTPIKELGGTADDAKNHIFKSLAAVKREGDADWTISNQAKTRLDEDAKFSGGGSSSSAYNFTLEELGQGHGTRQSTSVDTDQVREAPPYEVTNFNGDLNIGSYGVAVPIEVYSFVADYVQHHEVNFSEKQMVVLAQRLVSLASTLQLEMYDNKYTKPNLAIASHMRARHVLYEVIRIFYPLTNDLFDDVSDWENKVYHKSAGLFKWSVNTFQKAL